MKTHLLILVLLVSWTSFSQDCEVLGKKDWALVEVRILTEAKSPAGYKFVGESIERGLFISSLDEISDKMLMKIKQKVANDARCVVYIDLHKLIGADSGLYYVWTDEPPGASTISAP